MAGWGLSAESSSFLSSAELIPSCPLGVTATSRASAGVTSGPCPTPHTPQLPLPRGCSCLAGTGMPLMSKITLRSKLAVCDKVGGCSHSTGGRAGAGGLHPHSAWDRGGPSGSRSNGDDGTSVLPKTPPAKKMWLCHSVLLVRGLGGPEGAGGKGELYRGCLEPPRMYGAKTTVSITCPPKVGAPRAHPGPVPALDTRGVWGSILHCVGVPLTPCSSCTRRFLSTWILGRGLDGLLITQLLASFLLLLTVGFLLPSLGG